jgi:hypothetical protein
MRDRKRSERGENANRGTGEFAYLMQRDGWFLHRMIKHLSTNQKRPPQLGGLFHFLSGTNVIEVINLRQAVRTTKTALGNPGRLFANPDGSAGRRGQLHHERGRPRVRSAEICQICTAAAFASAGRVVVNV